MISLIGVIGVKRRGGMSLGIPLASLLMLVACDNKPAGVSGDIGRVTPRVSNAALAAGEADMALRVANLILERDPGSVPAMITRANALYATGDMTGAGTAYRAATTRDPSSAIAWLGLGRVLLRSDPHAAALAFQTAVARAPDNAAGWNNLGIARDLEGLHDEAQLAYRRSLALVPGAGDVRVNLGLSLALSGHGPEAVALLRPLATRPGAPQTWRDDFEVARAVADGAAPPPTPPAIATPAAAAPPVALPPIAVPPPPIAPVAAVAMPEAPKAAELLPKQSETSQSPGMAVTAAASPAPALTEPTEAADDDPGAAGARGFVPPPPPALAAASPAAPPAITTPAAAAPPVALPPVAVQSPPTVPVTAVAIPEAPKAAEALPKQSETLPSPGMAVAAAAAPAPEATAADTSAPSIGSPAPAPPDALYVQLGALDSEARARLAWRQLLARMPQLVGQHTPTIAAAEVRGRVYWRLRTSGFASLDEARKFCTQVRAIGWSHGCWVP